DIINEERDLVMGSNRAHVQGLPMRAYLDQTVVPVLVEGLKALVKERPPNPCEYLAIFLLRNGQKISR
ncbi:Protein dpy-30, partial [Borealophlyctis nickersoniae]